MTNNDHYDTNGRHTDVDAARGEAADDTIEREARLRFMDEPRTLVLEIHYNPREAYRHSAFIRVMTDKHHMTVGDAIAGDIAALFDNDSISAHVHIIGDDPVGEPEVEREFSVARYGVREAQDGPDEAKGEKGT